MGGHVAHVQRMSDQWLLLTTRGLYRTVVPCSTDCIYIMLRLNFRSK
jgi:hypothetical protein